MENTFPEYKTETLRLELAGTSFHIIRVTNTDELYAKLVEKGEGHADVLDERIPYWADLWPSALALAEEIMTNPIISAGRSVLEIGCGLGLPGLAAGKRGAKIVMTDYLPEPLAFAKKNWRENLSTEGDFGLLDWRNPGPGFASEILLASDVAYEKRSFESLLKAFRTLVLPGGRILLSEPNRPMAADFFRQLPGQGFDFRKKRVTVSLNGRANEVSVYEIWDKSNSDL
jgi:predicted nicotinamide N-methyase